MIAGKMDGSSSSELKKEVEGEKPKKRKVSLTSKQKKAINDATTDSSIQQTQRKISKKKEE